jgi:hypothetical protein
MPPEARVITQEVPRRRAGANATQRMVDATETVGGDA